MGQTTISITQQDSSVRIFTASPFSLSSEDWARSRQQKRLRMTSIFEC